MNTVSPTRFPVLLRRIVATLQEGKVTTARWPPATRVDVCRFCRCGIHSIFHHAPVRVRLLSGVPGCVADEVRLVVAMVQQVSAFSSDEEAQLRSKLGLDESGLRLVLEGCAYILEQAAYHSVTDAVFAAELAEAGVGLAQVRDRRSEAVHFLCLSTRSRGSS